MDKKEKALGKKESEFHDGIGWKNAKKEVEQLSWWWRHESLFPQVLPFMAHSAFVTDEKNMNELNLVCVAFFSWLETGCCAFSQPKL